MRRFLNNILLTINTIENLHVFLLDYLGLVKSDVVYKIRNSRYKFVARGGTSDKEQIVVVMSGFEYPFHVLPKLSEPVILDVGAYIGDSSIYIDKYFKGRCKIIAIEPDRENFIYCKKNLKNNKVKAKLLNIAIGNTNRISYLSKEDLPKDAFHLSDRGSPCSVITLPSLFKELNLSKIDVLKMDIEGGEYEIFNDNDSYKFIKRNVSYLFIEYHYDYGIKVVKQLLNKLEKDFLVLHHRDNLMSLKNKTGII